MDGAPGFQSVSRETLSGQVAEQLLDYIVARGLAPGTRLPSEQKLADDFDVSRPVIREALHTLAGQRVIEIVNGKGAVVSPLDGHLLGLFFQRAVQMKGESVEELVEVRPYLEVPMARLAAERRTREDLERLGTIIREMREEPEDSARYVELDVDLHVAIARATHNMILYHVVASIRTALAEVIGAVFLRQPCPETLRGVHGKSKAMHEAIYDAIVRQDGSAAEKAMRAHLADAYEAVTGRASGLESPS